MYMYFACVNVSPVYFYLFYFFTVLCSLYLLMLKFTSLNFF